MSVLCPFCSAPLPPNDLAEGWCDSCGKRLPSTMVPNAAGHFVGSSPGSRSAPAAPLRLVWRYLLGAAFFGVLGVAILVSAIQAKYTEGTFRSSRTGTVFTKGATEQRIEALVGGLGLLVLAGFLATRSVTRKPAPPTPAGGWWLVPVPPERRAMAGGAATAGLFFALPLALGFGGFTLIFPLLRGPMDMGGIACLGPASGVALALVVHFFAVRRGFTLAPLGWLAIAIIFVGLAWLVNGVAPAGGVGNP